MKSNTYDLRVYFSLLPFVLYDQIYFQQLFQTEWLRLPPSSYTYFTTILPQTRYLYRRVCTKSFESVDVDKFILIKKYITSI